MAPRLFGTDGVRGHAGQWPLDPVTVRRLGAAIVRVLDPAAGPARLLIGRDTRESGAWIERELAYGAPLSGATVIAAGVLPTPAVAYLTRASDITLGAVISASHNPFEDNGIKVFSGGGQKFTEELERRVEQEIADPQLVGRRGRRARAGRHGPHEPRTAITCARCCPTPAACGARPGRGLRQRRDHQRGAAGVCRSRIRRRSDRRLARRTQHQPRLRIDPPGGDGRARGRTRRDCRRRLRRRRRPRDPRRRARAAGRWRRRDADVRAADEGRGPPARGHRGRHGHEQHRARAGAGRIRHRAAPHAGGRQVRDGGDRP